MFRKALLIWLLTFQILGFSNASKHAITDGNAGPARFGDHLLCYSQARYLSYLTSVPFLYKPFRYSDNLKLDFQALPFDQHGHHYKSVFPIYSTGTMVEFFRKILDPTTSPTLFIVEYFPADLSEFDGHFSRNIFLNVKWDDSGFKQYLKQSIIPRIPFPNLRKEGVLNVAAHIRTLSGTDTVHEINCMPLKFPKLSYHRRQIQKIYEWNLRQPMHVFLFSDTKSPDKLIEYFRQHFAGTSITFDIQRHDRPDTNHFLQDFFAMQEFDVIIATQSNLSKMAAHLGNCTMTILPVHVRGSFPNSDIDRVQIISKQSEWFPYDLDVIIREENLSTSNQDWFFEVQR